MTINATSFKRAAIPDNSVTNSKISQSPASTIKGNSTGSTTNVSDLTVSQVKTMLSINNVDNTSDANKPVSTAQQTALNLKQNKSSTRYFKGNISGAVTIDFANGDYQVCTTTAAVTGITISNLPTEQGMILEIYNSAGYAVTYNSIEIIAATDTGRYACAFYNNNGTVYFMGKGRMY